MDDGGTSQFTKSEYDFACIHKHLRFVASPGKMKLVVYYHPLAVSFKLASFEDLHLQFYKDIITWNKFKL